MNIPSIVKITPFAFLALITTSLAQGPLVTAAVALEDPFGDNPSDSESAFFGAVDAHVFSLRGTADVYSTFGLLRLSGEITSSNNPAALPLTQSFGAVARFRDSLTIDSPGLHGTSGRVTGHYLLDGAIGYSGLLDPLNPNQARGHVDYTSVLSVNGVSDIIEYRLRDDGTTGDTDILGAPQDFTVDFTFGFPFTVQWSVTTSGRVPVRVQGVAYSALNQTATWQGISEVTGASGTSVPFTVLSASGTDYILPIPEPSVFVLIATALPLLLRRRRTLRTQDLNARRR